MNRVPDAAAIARLSSIISPLRRGVLKAARTAEHLPDLPDAQVEILRALPAGAVRAPGELAAELGLSRPTVSNLLRAMEASGLITRRASAENRRGVDVRASDLALALFERFDRASERVLADGLSLLAADDRAALFAALPALERLRDAVQAAAREHALTP